MHSRREGGRGPGLEGGVSGYACMFMQISSDISFGEIGGEDRK